MEHNALTQHKPFTAGRIWDAMKLKKEQKQIQKRHLHVQATSSYLNTAYIWRSLSE